MVSNLNLNRMLLLLFVVVGFEERLVLRSGHDAALLVFVPSPVVVAVAAAAAAAVPFLFLLSPFLLLTPTSPCPQPPIFQILNLHPCAAVQSPEQLQTEAGYDIVAEEVEDGGEGAIDEDEQPRPRQGLVGLGLLEEAGTGGAGRGPIEKN